jgi:putative ABC transport system permease protein
MRILWQDLRYGVRTFLKQPGFTLVAVLTLTLGIGANSVIFSVVNAVLLRPLSFKEPEQLIRIWETLPQGGTGTASVPNLKDWRDQNDVFTQVAGYMTPSFNLQNQDSPERVSGATVTTDFFNVLGVPPQLGRTFREGEDQPGNHRVVVLSNQLWQRNFSSDPRIVGKNILVNGESFTIIGVMPPGFRFPARLTELWTPLALPHDRAGNRGSHFLSVIALLKPGVTLTQAQQQMSGIARRLEEQYPDNQAGRGILLAQLQETMVRNARPALLVLLSAVGFVLLIACTNVANLLLARATARRREIAIRLALGAGRWRLMRQLLTESLLLSMIGGALGLSLAKWGVNVLATMAAQVLPRSSEVGLDGRVAAFTLLLSLFTGIVFGLVPAIQSSGVDVQTTLKEGGSAGESRQSNWLRSLLVVAEIAAAFILLIGAGLTIKTFIHLQRADAGLRSENVLTMSLTLPEAKYQTPPSSASFFRRLLERVSSLPGVEAAGVINLLPLQQWGSNSDFQIEGRPPFPPGKAPLVENRVVSPDYFRALGIPLIAGRFLNAQDNEQSIRVTLINQTFAQRYFPNQDAIGKRIDPGYGEWMTIVGVVGDVKQSGLTQAVRAEHYAPYSQLRVSNTMSLAVRTSSDPTSLGAAIRREVQALDPSLPIYNVKTMETVIRESVSDRRLNMILLGLFAAVAVTLAIVGIYSVMSYTVTQSTREIGIRVALGAQQRDILKLVLGHGLVLAIAGIGIGLAGAILLTRLMRALLFGVSATDPLTFSGVSAMLIVAALLACFIPARRAAKVDPITALRHE